MKKYSGNILLVANFPSDVGFAWWLMENFWYEISKYFSKNRIKCTLIYPKINTLPEIIKNSSIEVIEHDFSKKDLASLLKLIRIIKKRNIKYVYLTDRPYFDWFYFVNRLSGVKIIINHDHTPGERKNSSLLKRYLKKAIHTIRIFSCNYYIAVSKFVMTRAVETGCVPKNKCTYIHNGIRLFDNKKTDYAKNVFIIPKNFKIVVSTGRATFYKGIDRLLLVADDLINEKSFEDLFFIHIGSGPDLELFKKMSVELRIDHRFIFAGYREDISKILPSCDIGIQLSVGEAFSLSILEYLCAGLTVLAPDVCGNSEAIVNGVNGYLFDYDDIDQIIEKIVYILDHPEIANNLSNAARKTFEEKFLIEKCNQKLIYKIDELFKN